MLIQVPPSPRIHDEFAECTQCPEIHTFDFGDYSKGARDAGGVHYHQVGVGQDAPPQFKSVSTIVQELGHGGRVIDIFKIDCEGCEWQTAQHWFHSNVTLRQIQVELHGSDIQNTPPSFLISCTKTIT